MLDRRAALARYVALTGAPAAAGTLCFSSQQRERRACGFA